MRSSNGLDCRRQADVLEHSRVQREDRIPELVNRRFDGDPSALYPRLVRCAVEVLSRAKQILHGVVVQSFGKSPALAFFRGEDLLDKPTATRREFRDALTPLYRAVELPSDLNEKELNDGEQCQGAETGGAVQVHREPGHECDRSFGGELQSPLVRGRRPNVLVCQARCIRRSSRS